MTRCVKKNLTSVARRIYLFRVLQVKIKVVRSTHIFPTGFHLKLHDSPTAVEVLSKGTKILQYFGSDIEFQELPQFFWLSILLHVMFTKALLLVALVVSRPPCWAHYFSTAILSVLYCICTRCCTSHSDFVHILYSNCNKFYSLTGCIAWRHCICSKQSGNSGNLQIA